MEIKVEAKDVLLQFVKAKRAIFLKSLQQDFSLEKLQIESTMANDTNTNGFIVLKGPRLTVLKAEHEISQILQKYVK